MPDNDKQAKPISTEAVERAFMKVFPEFATKERMKNYDPKKVEAEMDEHLRKSAEIRRKQGLQA